MLNRKYQHIQSENAPHIGMGKSGSIGLIVASMVGILVWLVFIFLFARTVRRVQSVPEHHCLHRIAVHHWFADRLDVDYLGTR